MVALLICLAIYLISAFLCWLYIHIDHSEKGCYSHIEPCRFEFLVTITPILNTLSTFIWLHQSPYSAEHRSKQPKFFRWFFNVKQKSNGM